jgi:hypothetical protein
VIFFAVMGLALAEIFAHVITRARAPEKAAWARAAAYVRARYEPGDAIVAAPSWADPLVREALGDVIDLAQAGRSDLAGFDRLWALSIRGRLPEGAPEREPDDDRLFDGVRVMRWDLGPSSVRYDFVDHVREAEVALGEGSGAAPCRWARAGARGGGLGAGAFWPEERFACGFGRGFLWVGETVTEDLDLKPRRCIHQQPEGSVPLRVTFRDVPSTQRLVLYAGLYYEDERSLERGPFTLRVRRDGVEVGRMEHRDGEGWKRLELAFPPSPSHARAASFTFETTSPAPDRRSVCWAATMRVAPREVGE